LISSNTYIQEEKSTSKSWIEEYYLELECNNNVGMKNVGRELVGNYYRTKLGRFITFEKLFRSNSKNFVKKLNILNILLYKVLNLTLCASIFLFLKITVNNFLQLLKWVGCKGA